MDSISKYRLCTQSKMMYSVTSNIFFDLDSRSLRISFPLLSSIPFSYDYFTSSNTLVWERKKKKRRGGILSTRQKKFQQHTMRSRTQLKILKTETQRESFDELSTKALNTTSGVISTYIRALAMTHQRMYEFNMIAHFGYFHLLYRTIFEMTSQYMSEHL